MRPGLLLQAWKAAHPLGVDGAGEVGSVNWGGGGEGASAAAVATVVVAENVDVVAAATAENAVTVADSEVEVAKTVMLTQGRWSNIEFMMRVVR